MAPELPQRNVENCLLRAWHVKNVKKQERPVQVANVATAMALSQNFVVVAREQFERQVGRPVSQDPGLLRLITLDKLVSTSFYMVHTSRSNGSNDVS